MLRERRVDVQGLAGWGRVCSFAQHRRGHRMITHSLDQLQVDPTWVIQWCIVHETPFWPDLRARSCDQYPRK